MDTLPSDADGELEPRALDSQELASMEEAGPEEMKDLFSRLGVEYDQLAEGE